MAFVHYRLRRHHALGSALISSVAALGGRFVHRHLYRGCSGHFGTSRFSRSEHPGRLVLQHRLGRWSILDSLLLDHSLVLRSPISCHP